MKKMYQPNNGKEVFFLKNTAHIERSGSGGCEKRRRTRKIQPLQRKNDDDDDDGEQIHSSRAYCVWFLFSSIVDVFFPSSNSFCCVCGEGCDLKKVL